VLRVPSAVADTVDMSLTGDKACSHICVRADVTRGSILLLMEQ
jgi:hypothetical protein